MKVQFAFLLLSLAISVTGNSAEPNLKPYSLECEALESLESRVNSCTENAVAVDSAKQCHEALLKAWREAPKDLKKNFSFNKANKERKQEESLNDAQRDYQRSMDKLNNLIEVTDRNTELLSNYPLIMREDPETQVECYTQAFDKLQKIVDDLDDKLEEGELALAGSSLRKGISKVRDEQVDSTIGSPLIPSPKTSSATQIYRAKVNASRDSDVTGLKGEKEQDKLKLSISPAAPTVPAVDYKKMKGQSDPAWVDSFLENRSK